MYISRQFELPRLRTIFKSKKGKGPFSRPAQHIVFLIKNGYLVTYKLKKV